MKCLAMVCTLALSLSVLGVPRPAVAQNGAPAAGDRSGQNIAGAVTNATTGKPLTNASIALVRLQNGMQPVGTTISDAQGRYRFSESAPGPYMVQTDFDGVTYYARATAGESETDLRVYGASHDTAGMQVDAEIMVLQPSQGQLAVVNEYRVENLQQPPRTLTRKGGMFRFRTAPGATVDLVRVVAPGQMPLSHQAVPTADHDVYSVDTPLRPGETRIQISYRLPYASLQAAITETPVEPTAHFEVYVPAPMQFSGAGFVELGEQDGYKVYGVGSAPPLPTSFHFQVSGSAPLPAAAAQASGANQAGGADQASGNDASSGVNTTGGGAEAAAAPVARAGVTPEPTFLERNRWTILALLAIAAAVGFGILLAKPGEAEAEAPFPPLAPIPSLALPPAPGAPDELSRLKDDLFLLEVQRHTGRLGEAEYQRQRAALNARMEALAQALLPHA